MQNLGCVDTQTSLQVVILNESLDNFQRIQTIITSQDAAQKPKSYRKIEAKNVGWYLGLMSWSEVKSVVCTIVTCSLSCMSEIL